jgi:hypothetical protein
VFVSQLGQHPGVGHLVVDLLVRFAVLLSFPRRAAQVLQVTHYRLGYIARCRDVGDDLGECVFQVLDLGIQAGGIRFA